MKYSCLSSYHSLVRIMSVMQGCLSKFWEISVNMEQCVNFVSAYSGLYLLLGLGYGYMKKERIIFSLNILGFDSFSFSKV